MAKRRITVDGRVQFISECEPLADTNLESTTEGCEDDLFSHEMEAKKTYFKKRYFMLGPNDVRQYCTDCIRSPEMVHHQRRQDGYQHDDANHVSYQKKEVFIEFAIIGIPQRIQVRAPAVEPNEPAIPHQITGIRQQQGDIIRYEGCFPIYGTSNVHDYSRPDGSTYTVVAGSGDPIQGTNLCTQTKRRRMVYRDRGYVIEDVYFQHYPGNFPSQEIRVERMASITAYAGQRGNEWARLKDGSSFHFTGIAPYPGQELWFN